MHTHVLLNSSTEEMNIQKIGEFINWANIQIINNNHKA